MTNPSMGDRTRYAAEQIMEPVLRRWFGIDLDPVDAERNAENAAVDLSWRLEEAGLLALPAPAPEGVPEDRIVPEGMANIGGVTYWAHPTTCGCSYYRAEMMTEGPCVCGHDQDDHDYYDGGCEAPDPHRARLVPLSDTPHEEGEQP